MCDTIDSKNIKELEAKYESIKSGQLYLISSNAWKLVKESFFDSLDSVVVANLSDLDLTTLPQLIFLACNIKALDLSFNSLQELRGPWEHWHYLRLLDLSHNEFQAIPSAVIQMSTLRCLSISSNFLERIPFDWSPLNALEELDLSFNRIVDVSSLVNIPSLKILNLSGNIISVLPSDIYKLENLSTLKCHRNQIHNLPNSLVQLKALQELTVQDNPLVFPPFDIVSRGLAHILAFLSRNKQKGLYAPPLQQEQYGEEEEDLEETSSSRQSPNHSSDTLLSSTASRPSSAMAVLTWQQCNSPLTSNRGQRQKPFIRTGSSHFERHIIRRRSSQPEFYKRDVAESGDTDYSSVSLSSLSEERISAFELQEPCSSQQLEKEGCHRRMCSSYLSISYNQQKMNQERCRLILGSSDRPQPPPRSTLPSAVASGSKLYVRQRTPSPPPRKPQPLVPLPRMSNASLSKARPLLRPQRSYSPTMHSPRSRLPNDRSQTRQTSYAPRGVVEGSDDDSSTDSSCEDLPVPRLRNHFPLNVTSSLSTQHHLTPLPRQSVPPSAASLHQHHRYLKHGQATGSVQPKVNPNLFLQQQLASQVRRRPYRDDRSNATFSPSYETLPSPRPLYPQTHQYDELWRSTAESLRMILVSHLDINLPSTPVELANELKTGICLAEFLNSFLGYKAIKKIYEVSGSSWRFRARQNLFSSREVIHNVGVPKHRLFSVTRVLAGDTTVGLFGLLHCLQTLLEVWASRPSTFVLGGLGVREKLTNQPTPYRSLLGDITTNRRMHHKSQQRNRYPTPNSNYGVGVNDYGGVFSDV